MAQLAHSGIKVNHNPTESRAEVVVINTCGFIGDAKEESINTILQFAQAKQQRRICRLYVMGCLSERYRDELTEQIPEVDKFYGKFDWAGIVADLGATYRRDLSDLRTLTTPSHYAYLKISEGCNRMCSYCAIPLITGRHTSRPIEDIVAEVETLAKRGVKEIQVIAQDLSSYGRDLYGQSRLASLTEQISAVSGIEWVRLHYAYPSDFPMDILDVMAHNHKVCQYIDLALQHISDNMLRLMRRHITKEQTIALLNDIRRHVPGIHIRTTLIVGHPGETEQDFQELLQFVSETKFERLGVFTYSHEEDTYAYKHYTDDIPEDVKNSRAEQIMNLQADISYSLGQKKIGSVLPVIIDGVESDNTYVGRTQFDSPEVDPIVIVHSDSSLQMGQIVNVRITEAEEYDLIGSVVSNNI